MNRSLKEAACPWRCGLRSGRIRALLARHARLERLARETVRAVRKEHQDAMLRVGDGRANKEAAYAAVLALYAALGSAEEDQGGGTRPIVVELLAEWVPLLGALTSHRYGIADVSEVLAELADHAQQGVYRPGVMGARVADPGVQRRVHRAPGAGRAARPPEQRRPGDLRPAEGVTRLNSAHQKYGLLGATFVVGLGVGAFLAVTTDMPPAVAIAGVFVIVVIASLVAFRGGE